MNIWTTRTGLTRSPEHGALNNQKATPSEVAFFYGQGSEVFAPGREKGTQPGCETT